MNHRWLFFQSLLFSTSLLGTTESLRLDRMAPISRRIKGCKTVEEALGLLNNYITTTPPDQLSDDPFLATMHICGKRKDFNQAQQIYCKQRSNSEACQRLLIQIAGKCRKPDEAVQLLRSNQSQQSTPSIGTYHAAMSACGQAGAWNTVLELFKEIPKDQLPTSSLTYNVVLTALARSKRGIEALQILHTMKNPDRVSYQKTIDALCSMGKIHLAYDLCKDHCPTDTAASDIIISAYGKREQWDMVRMVQTTLHRDAGSHDFELWHEGDAMIKVGKGRSAHWEIGTYRNFIVGLQPHRNPSKNGIKVLLLEGQQKIGYLLMINSSVKMESSMLGAYMDPDQRKRGLSKILLGLWMSMCLHAGIRPTTGMINKPLLALVLQDTFGFTPSPTAGVYVELSRSSDDNNAIVLYSATKSLQGSFSPPDILRENIVFSDRPAANGRTVKVQTPFDPPSLTEELKERVVAVLKGPGNGEGVFTHSQSSESLRRIMLGK